MAAEVNLITLSNKIKQFVPLEEQTELLDTVETLSDILDGNMLMKSTKAKSIIPTGTIFPFAGKGTVPEDFLLCDGRAVSRTDYADLFVVIGTTYGSGDGSKTFNLPNLIAKFIEGGNASESGTEMKAGLPNIKGTFDTMKMNPSATGTFTSATTTRTQERCNSNDGGADSQWKTTMNASKSNPIYGNSDTVQPPAIKMQYIIKI